MSRKNSIPTPCLRLTPAPVAFPDALGPGKNRKTRSSGDVVRLAEDLRARFDRDDGISRPDPSRSRDFQRRCRHPRVFRKLTPLPKTRAAPTPGRPAQGQAARRAGSTQNPDRPHPGVRRGGMCLGPVGRPALCRLRTRRLGIPPARAGPGLIPQRHQTLHGSRGTCPGEGDILFLRPPDRRRGRLFSIGLIGPLPAVRNAGRTRTLWPMPRPSRNSSQSRSARPRP